MNKKFLLTITSIFVTLSFINNSAYAETASFQFFTVRVLDSETGLFVGTGAIMRVTLEREGKLYPATAGIYISTQTFVLPPLQEGDIITVRVHKEGYKDSEPFVYTVTPETAKEAEIFHHTFYLEPLIKPTLVQVIVKDTMNQPIKNADVKVLGIYVDESFTGKTDENGNFSFYTRFEDFQIYISAEGYKPFEDRLKVTHETPKMLYEAKLEYLTARIIIEVKDEAWNPISGANVTLISKETSFEENSNASGLVEFEVPTTNYTMKVFKEGYVPHEEAFELSVPSTIMKSIQLYPSVRLTLEIKDEAGNPIRDANITLAFDAGNFSKTTNGSGIAEFEIPRANYTLSVTKKGYLPYEEVLDLSKSPIESKVIQLKTELAWWQNYKSYFIIGTIIAVCIIVLIVFRLKRKSL
jgi:hypothetical protein